jgi:hypothetical protein
VRINQKILVATHNQDSQQHARDSEIQTLLSLQHVHLDSVSISPSALVKNSDEATFWKLYDVEADILQFDGGLKESCALSNDVRLEQEQIEKEMREFGDWNEVSAGYSLGAPLPEDEEHQAALRTEIEQDDDERQMQDMLSALGNYASPIIPDMSNFFLQMSMTPLSKGKILMRRNGILMARK